ncbi:MAG: hypothetical protein HOH43_04375 [Candidatus Latescibacteria bacterium]|jgi:hypothetical protein|nr:hypothetical protein [Candidatus Latescibacterota bacterium]
MKTQNPKVFCIGLQRTGTTSLHSALEILGYRSVHGAFAMFPDPSQDVLDQYDAFSDNPIPLLYQALDKRCPGSKFILTTRDIEGWLRSVKWLFTTGRIEGNWQADPIIDHVHAALYGASDYDESQFRRTWQEYHDEVSLYFSDRSQDLLMLDLALDNKWEALCRFLNAEIPEVDFPSSNKSSVLRTLIAPAKHLVKRLIGWRLTDHNMKQ